jgi:hypothetical protein
MAALLLARLLTRPDMGPALEAFLDWQQGALADAPPAKMQFLLPGVLQVATGRRPRAQRRFGQHQGGDSSQPVSPSTSEGRRDRALESSLARLITRCMKEGLPTLPTATHVPLLQALALTFKLGRRPALLPAAPRVWSQLAALWDAADAPGGPEGTAAACMAGSSLARRLAVKLAQRLGLTLLAPRAARWRYVRQRAMLLGGGASGALGGPAAAPETGSRDESEVIEVVEEVEGILGCLLGGLRDPDTAVRWTASKGVARLTGCLPADLGSDVIDGVMALFGPAGGPARSPGRG